MLFMMYFSDDFFLFVFGNWENYFKCTQWDDLHMLWMVANAIDQLVWLQFASANVMDGGEQWESGKGENINRVELVPLIILFVWLSWVWKWHLLLFHSFVFKHKVNFFGGDWSLQFLTVQHFSFQFFDWFASPNICFRHFTVATTCHTEI